MANITDFIIQLEGRRVAVSARHSGTREFCEAYLCDSKPDFSVCLTPEDIAFERERSRREDELEGIPVREYSDEYLETLALLRKITEELQIWRRCPTRRLPSGCSKKSYICSSKRLCSRTAPTNQRSSYGQSKRQI